MVSLVYIYIAVLLISCLFITAGWHKLRSPGYYALIIAEYRLPFIAGRRINALILGAFELLLGLGLLVPVCREFAAWMAVALLAFYGFAIALNILRGRSSIDCGCSGPAAQQQPLSGWLLLRNGVLVLLAVVAGLKPSGSELIWVDAIVIMMSLALAILLYAIFGQLLANRTMLKNLRS